MKQIPKSLLKEAKLTQEEIELLKRLGLIPEEKRKAGRPRKKPELKEYYLVKYFRCKLCGGLTISRWHMIPEGDHLRGEKISEIPKDVEPKVEEHFVETCEQCSQRLRNLKKEELIELLIKCRRWLG